jgi:RHS repeat-associated protein
MKFHQRGLAIILSLLLILTSIPLNTFAENINTVKENTNLVETPAVSLSENNLTARKENNGKPIELIKERKEREKVFDNQDGTLTKKIYKQPIHIKKGETWEEISTKLEKNKNGKLQPKTTDINVQFESLTNETYVNYQDGDNYISFNLVTADGESGSIKANQNISPVVEENKIWHKEIFPNIDLRNIVLNKSTKEDIILNKYTGHNTFNFQISTNLLPVLNEDGSIAFQDKNEEELFSLPKPTMSDSNFNQESGETAFSDQVEYSINKVKAGLYTLTITADAAWLKSPDRVYPVYIDPTVNKWPFEEFENAYVSSAYPNNNYSGEDLWESDRGAYLLKVGKFSSATGDNYAYLKQDLSGLKEATILNAKMWLYTDWSYYSTSPTGVWLSEASSGWDSSTITWNNSPSVTNIAYTEVYRTQWAAFDVTSTIQKWANNPTINYGFAVHTNGNGQTHWKKFIAAEHYYVDPYYVPELEVTYSFPDVTNPTVKASPDGNGTGYLDISWTKVSGAIGYSVGIYNGKEYQYFDLDGDVSSWSTKGLGIWPTNSEISNGNYQLHYDGQGDELPLDPSPVYKNANKLTSSPPSWVNDSTFWVVVKAYYPEGSVSTSPGYASTKIPMDKPSGTTYTYPLDPTRGHIDLNWVPIKGASGYKVLVFNGRDYDTIDAGNVTSWSTEGRNLWPTDAEITSTEKRYRLHTDGTLGAEFPLDPSPVYQNSGGGWGTSKDYWVRVIAYNSTGTQIGAHSDYGTFRFAESNPSLGLEDYWASIDVVGGKVNAFNGNLVIDETDFQLTGNGPDVTIARTYNSQDQETGLFGKGWFSSIEENIKEADNGDLLYTTGDKTVYRFVKMGTNSYSAPSGVYLKISKENNGMYTIEDKDKTKITFAADGKLQSETDDHGKVVKYEYTDNKLTNITDAVGRSFILVYEGNLIEEINGPAGKKVSFTYDPITNHLRSSETPSGKLFRYGYEDGVLKYLYDPKHTDEKEYKTTYIYENGKVKNVIDPVNKTTTLDYYAENKQVIIKNPKLNKTTIKYNLSGNLIESVVDSDDQSPKSLKLKTTYEYIGNNVVKTVTPKNQSESLTYDKNGNVTLVTDPSGTEKAQYNSNNDVIKTTDNENRTTTVAYKDKDAVSVTDNNALTSSVAMYDSYGNTTEASGEYAPGYNLLKNSHMEEDSNWTISSWYDSGEGLFDGKVEKMGERSLWLSSKSTTNGYGYITASQVVSVKPKTTYTLSGFIRAEEMKNSSALLQIYEYDVNNQKVASHGNGYSRITAKSPDWTKRQLTFTTNDKTTKVEVFLTVEHIGDGTAYGEAWFDNIQLEKGAVSSSYNPVSNSSFEDHSQGTFSSWARLCSNCGDPANNVSYLSFEGNTSLFLERTSESQSNTLYQNKITLNQQNPKKVTLTGMSRSENVTNKDTKDPNGDYSLMAAVVYNDNTAVDYYAVFPLGTHEWNRGAVVINPRTSGIKYINVYILFRNNNKGKVWFDDIRLIEGSILEKNSYDANGYLQDSADEEGNITSYKFDEYGNKKTEIDPKGNKKSYDYTQDNQLETVTLPNGTTVTYVYDLNGNIEEKIVANTKEEIGKNTFHYNQDNKVIYFKDSIGNEIFHDYDDNGNKNKTVMPNKNIQEWNYDTADRLTNIKRGTESEGTTDAFTYELDNNGNQKTIIDHINNITTTNDYDDNDRLYISQNSLGGKINWFFYDTPTSKTGKVKDITFTQGTTSHTTSYFYNSLDQNTKIVDGYGKTYSFDYNEQGNVDTYIAGNGSGSSFVYDHSGKVKELTIGTKTGETILSEVYEYDKNGNRIMSKDTDSPAGITYEYDSLNQLLEVKNPETGKSFSYRYDEFGNRTSVNGKVLQYNKGNQLEWYGDERIEYDLNGNRTFDDTYDYKWDAADQLISVTRKGEATPFIEYKYDDDGRRIEKKVKQSDGNLQTTRYVYDGSSINVLYETDENGKVLRHYLYSASGIRVAIITQGKTFYYHYNPHGDVIAMTDDAGKVVASYEYNAWGIVLSSNVSPEVADNPFGYAGYMYDKEIGMYYLMARYYHPVHGVFLSVDPDPGDEDDPITQNGYNYTNNNPINFVDNDGHRTHRPSHLTGPAGMGRGGGMKAGSGSGKHKNSNSYVGHQGVYEIRINGILQKYGKADMTRLSSTGNPRRLQSQLNKLQNKNPKSLVTGRIIYRNKNISTKDIKKIETRAIQKYYDKYKNYPPGNQNHPGIKK